MFALVDCNNFYVSCERVFCPKLVGKPVVVLSNNDGCIIARSEEAKELGLKMAEPAFKRTTFLKENEVHIFSSNYTLYGDMSQRVIKTLSKFVPELEIYSIDEVFMNLSGVETNLNEFSEKIIATIWQNTGIPISVGIGQTKTLAKIASKAAKKCGGTYIIRNNQHRDATIRNTPIEKIWGIGRQYIKLLKRNAIHTAFDFVSLDDYWIRINMKVMGLRIKKELLGESCIPLELITPPKKAIATTRAFGKKTSELKILEEAVSTYAVRCAEKLRKQKSVANILTVFIHSDPFKLNESQINKSKTITLPLASNTNSEIVKYAVFCLKEIYQANYLYKKAGVIVEGLQSEFAIQKNIFDNEDGIRQQKISKSVDALNSKFGKDKVKLAVQGDGEKWKLRQEKRSKRYTTNWNEILEINI